MRRGIADHFQKRPSRGAHYQGGEHIKSAHHVVALAATVALTTVGLAGCQLNPTALGRSPQRDDTPAATSTSAPSTTTPSTVPSATTSSTPTTTGATPPTLPRGGRILFPDKRIVAYYGGAGTPDLGVLGDGPPEKVWPRLAKQAAEYQDSAATVLPAYELISDVAQASPGADGDYSGAISDGQIQRYLTSARRHHALLILDIQPGRGEFLPMAKRLRHWLEQPDVALALDPEWKMHGHEVPGERIGHTDASVINEVSAWLEQLTTEHNLPQKLLLIHQFTHDMVHHKDQVSTRPDVELTFNMDGFGSRAAKLSKYKQLQSYHSFNLGLKLFYDQDVHIFTPDEVLALHSPPSVIEYQ